MDDTETKPQRKPPGPRKRSPRPFASGRRPGASEALRRCWADPVWREQMVAKIREGQKHWRGKRGADSRRYGIPDGMNRAQAQAIRTEVKESVAQTMSELEKAGVLDDSDQMAKEALQTSMEIMRMPGDQKIRLQAARQVLDFTKAKPAAKQELTINKAEEWLAAIAATGNDEADEGEADTDAEASA